MFANLYTNKFWTHICKVVMVSSLVLYIGMSGSYALADQVIELEYGNEALEAYKTYQLDLEYTYVSEDESVCTVNEGLVRAVKYGETTLQVINDDNEVIDSIFVIVYLVGNEPVPWADANFLRPYITGYSDGTFRPNQFMTRAELATILAKILELKAGSSQSFADVTSEHWAYTYIQQVALVELMTSSGDRHFYPEAYITRRDGAVLFSNYFTLKGYDVDHAELHIEDLEANDLAQKAIYAMVNAQVFYLNHNKFEPDGLIKRAQMVKLVNKILGRPINEPDKQTFSDVLVTSPYFKDIESSANNLK